jgi:N-acetyl-gamma-glutamylphosphate reductase
LTDFLSKRDARWGKGEWRDQARVGDTVVMPSTRTNLEQPMISGIHPEKRKVFAMIRVSTKQQDMEQQQANIDFYCLPENFNLEVVETFLFPGTGGDVVTKTAEFKRMLQALVNGPDVVGSSRSSIG